MALKKQLHADMLAAYKKAGIETGYWGNYYLRSVKLHGGLETAKRMLKKKLKNTLDQKGFRALVEAGRPDLSLESLVLKPQYRKLFTNEELAEARRRLNSVPEYAKRSAVLPENNHPDDLLNDQIFTEGAKKRITVNAYERDSKARKVCLKRHGYRCKVCNISFQEVYGQIGKKFIHVHHKKPLAGRRDDYKIVPSRDLIPVCPNCHAMLHTSNPPLGVKELRDLMDGS